MRHPLRTLLILLTLWVFPIIASGIEPELALIKEFERQLTDAVGDSFEFVRGVRVPMQQIPAKRALLDGQNGFWFAEVRAKRAGAFGLSYDAELPAKLNKSYWNESIDPVTHRFVAPVKIYPKDTRRVLGLREQGTLSNPQANIGDIVVLPVCLHQRIASYKFRLLTEEDQEVRIFTRVHQFAKPIEANLVDPQFVTVENAAASPIQIVQSGSWADSDVTGSSTRHHIYACLEFTRSDDFNLSGQLVDARDRSMSYPIHVVAKEEPITLILGWIRNAASYAGKPFRSPGGVIEIPWGTLETRVGDQLSMACGSYVTVGRSMAATAGRPIAPSGMGGGMPAGMPGGVSAKETNTSKRGATIKVEPFKAVDAYQASMK